jgi:cation transport regulator ChaB
MPYLKNGDLPKNVRDALPEGAQTTYRKAHNNAGKLYGYKNETRLSKIARVSVKRDYKQDKDKKWIARAEIKAAAQTEGKTGETHEYTTESWVPTGKVGMEVVLYPELAIDDPAQKTYILSADAFKAAEGTWRDGIIKINHKGQWINHEILDDKFEDEFLYMKFDQDVIDELNSAETTGGSIDALVIEHDTDLNATNMIGTGYSLTYAGFNPRCTFEMGCAGTIESKANIPTKDKGELVTAEEPGYVKSQLGGGHKDMADKVDKADKVEPVTYTSEQLNEQVAGALESAKEASDNALKVAVSDAVETQKIENDKVIDGLTQEKDATEKKLAEIAKVAVEQRCAIFKQRNGLKEGDELLTRFAQVGEDAQVLMNEIDFRPPQVAGASSGTVSDGSADIESVEEIGTYNPYTQKWEPTYREVSK